MPDLNALYRAWACDPSPTRLGDLLAGVTTTVVLRYDSKCDDALDIAQMVAVKIWRSLPGTSSKNPLRTYDPARGRFNPFVSCLARTTWLDSRRCLPDLPMPDSELERIAAGMAQVDEAIFSYYP